jgi:SAM-dependent methyltransferase
MEATSATTLRIGCAVVHTDGQLGAMEKPVATRPAPEVAAALAAAYFAAKAERYDEVDRQPYWALSDDLLWRLLNRLLLPALAPLARVDVLDAGAGTARWTQRLLAELPSACAHLVDLTPEMLSVARRKLEADLLNGRVQTEVADLQSWDPAGRDFNLVLCFHNVLSFVSDPRAVLGTLVKAVRPGGFLVLVVPNRYHAAWFALATGRLEEYERVQLTHEVKFAPDVPAMALFTPRGLRAALLDHGLSQVDVLGFPVAIYPQIEETTIDASSAFSVSVLSEPSQRQRILDFEEQMCLDPEAAARGNNLLVVGRAPHA